MDGQAHVAEANVIDAGMLEREQAIEGIVGDAAVRSLGIKPPYRQVSVASRVGADRSPMGSGRADGLPQLVPDHPSRGRACSWTRARRD
jgi:hypothetical protein